MTGEARTPQEGALVAEVETRANAKRIRAGIGPIAGPGPWDREESALAALDSLRAYIEQLEAQRADLREGWAQEHQEYEAQLKQLEGERDAASGSAKDWEVAHRGANILKRKWKERAEAAEQRVEALKAALRFYADEKTWTQPTSWGGRILDDEGPWVNDTGSKARAALAARTEGD